MIPALRAAFSEAVDEVHRSIVALNRNGYLPAPWLGDEVSNEVAAHYQLRALEGPNSSHKALVAYHAELRRIHDTLQQMEDHYRRTEGDNAATWGRRV
jgi:hypothetical protein